MSDQNDRQILNGDSNIWTVLIEKEFRIFTPLYEFRGTSIGIFRRKS